MVLFVFALAFVSLMGFAYGNLENSEELSTPKPLHILGTSDYVHVRSNAHMFYSLYLTTHPDKYYNRPWIIWLQGGPGGSSCGYGNFGIMGPKTIDGTHRNTTWVKQASILFVDSPVGAGFSYVDDPSAYNTQTSEVVDDLMVFLREFLNRTSYLRTRPLYIFGQSYGGKIAAHFARRLYDEIQLQSIQVQFVGFAMGNAWISPLASTLSYADFLYYMSLVDENGRDRIKAEVQTVKDAIDARNWRLAEENYWMVRSVIYMETNDVDTYDITKFNTVYVPDKETPLYIAMNGPIKTRLLSLIPQNVTWSGQSGKVFNNLIGEIMKPSVNVVDDLLQNTTLQVIVYQGQLDIICSTKGTMDWVQQLNWRNLTYYNMVDRKAFRNPVDNQTEFYVKAYDRFKFYFMNGAGHSVPQDKGESAYRMLDRILSNLDN